MEFSHPSINVLVILMNITSFGTCIVFRPVKLYNRQFLHLSTSHSDFALNLRDHVGAQHTEVESTSNKHSKVVWKMRTIISVPLTINFFHKGPHRFLTILILRKFLSFFSLFYLLAEPKVYAARCIVHWLW